MKSLDGFLFEPQKPRSSRDFVGAKS
jgi:hypothetical protein